MNISTKLSSATLSALDCPICSETLLDPRVLPCGHSFCGPPRICLKGIKLTDPEFLKCAVCNQTFKLKLDDLKPLYGIREALQDLSEESTGGSVKNQSSDWSVCKKHDNKVTLWCEDCSRELCPVCYEEKHLEHAISGLKTVLKKRAEEMIVKIEKAKRHISVQLEPSMKTCEKEIEKLTKELQIKNNLKSKLCKEKESLDRFLRMERELRKFCIGKQVDHNTIMSYLKQGESGFPEMDCKESKCSKFVLTISNIRKVKNGMECSNYVAFEDFRLCVEAFYKPDQLKNQPVLELYLSVTNCAKNVRSDKWQLKLNFSLTLENFVDTSKALLWSSDFVFKEGQSKRGSKFIEWGRLYDGRGYLNSDGDITLLLEVAKMN